MIVGRLFLILLLYVLQSSPTVEEQCAITQLNVRFISGQPFNFRDESTLTFVVDGAVIGGSPSTFTWRRNGAVLSPTFSTRPLPGVTGGEFYIGGFCPTNNSCERTTDYRTAIRISGRAPGEYSVTVNNADIPSAITNTTTIYSSNPVTGLAVTQFNDVRLRASWTAPANTESYLELVDYRVFINNESINSNGTIVPAGTTTYTLPGTYTPGTRVTVHVRATSRHLWSTTNTVPYTILGVQVPQVTPGVSTSSSVTLTMSQPNTPPAVSANQYITTLDSTACTNIPTRMITTTSNLITVDDLEAGIEYTARVTASNTNYGYASSSAGTATITTLESAPNGSPGIPTRSSRTAATVTLTWTEIDCIDQNGVITYYIIQYGEGTNRNMIINTTSSSLTHMISGLNPFTEYSFTVAGATAIGTGPMSSALNAIRTDESTPTAVRDVYHMSDLVSVLLAWSEPFPPNGVITNYTITYSINGSSPVMVGTSISPCFKILGLLPNTNVSGITVSATTSVGPGPVATYHSVTTWDALHTVAISQKYITDIQRSDSISQRYITDIPRSDSISQRYITDVPRVRLDTSIFIAVALSSLLVGVAGGSTATIIIIVVGCAFYKRKQKKLSFSPKVEGQPTQLYEEINLDVRATNSQDMKIQDNVAYGQVNI